MLNQITMMSMAAISGLIDNTTFYHIKNLRLVLLSGAAIAFFKFQHQMRTIGTSIIGVTEFLSFT
jgi:endonuclease III-like uncharacterized protein